MVDASAAVRHAQGHGRVQQSSVGGRWKLSGLTMLIVAAGCSRTAIDPAPHPATRSPGRVDSPVVIRQPPLPDGIQTTAMGPHGQPLRLQCAACHSIRPADPATTADTLDEFHQGLQFDHGSLLCGSCHQSADGYSTLKLADGRSLPFADSMTLCAQCHGTQWRDYQRGAHGGMTGYWDLTRGGRIRNHCLHCHDAHAPQFPVFAPVAGPRDRFPPASQGATHE
jgi:hypothetical protein